ncbi:MAG: RNA polymerase factor sigma-54 [Candidatus Poribacteria bacterium]|nr:RNA polymerase factor sigma-54 [Candidatus Poribacteria bacterium]
MRTSLGIRQSQRQAIVITPKMHQSIRIMQMDRLALLERIAEEMEENILLEEGVDADLENEFEREAEPLDSEDLEAEEAEENYPEIRVEDFMDDSLPPMRSSMEYEEFDEDRRPDFAVETTFLDELREQLAMKRLPEADRKVCEWILGNLDDDGFLAIELSELADRVGRSEDEVEEILIYIQKNFDPVGAASRNRQEFFIRQMEADESSDPIALAMVREHYADLLHNRAPKIAKALGCETERVQEAKQRLSHLKLSPASGFYEGYRGSKRYAQETFAISPDVTVSKENGEYVVSAANDSIPPLRLNRKYLNMLERAASLRPDEREWLERYRERALELIRNIHERGRTIELVAREIFEVQRDFLEQGKRALKPLGLCDIADRIGMHESTVSRATNGKYVQTPQGVFELKYFFSSGLRRRGGGKASSVSVRAEIERLVENEDPANPLSDEAISQLLKEDGTQVARRTVAKYRGQLGIPSSSLRKTQWK